MKNRITKIFTLLLCMGLVSSCLEDDRAPLDPSDTHNVIEFLDPSVPSSPAGAIYPVYSNSFTLAPQAEIELTVSYSGPRGNSKNIDLTLGIDPSALEEYNKQMEDELHGTTYSLLPDANYDFPTTSVTIPAGETKATFSLTVYPETFDFSKNYALPVRITSASTGVISAHFSVAILQIGVRNQYDGVYEIVGGSITRNSASGPDLVLGGNYVEGLTMDLVTLNGNTVGIEPLWKDGSLVGGVTGTNLVINPNTNQVTVSSTGNATMKNTVGQLNAYNPDTKEFTLNFDWGVAPSTRIISGLVLRYVGPRP